MARLPIAADLGANHIDAGELVSARDADVWHRAVNTRDATLSRSWREKRCVEFVRER
ncbi:MAG: hypothetical protein ABR582_01885 [Gemmatimonadaceae bacterium]